MIKMNREVEGIVIYYQEYKENDVILHVVTKDDEKIQCIAKGVQKITSKNASACQLFTYTRLQLFQRGSNSIQTLKSAEIIYGYRHIREDLIKQTIATYMCECIDKSEFVQNMFYLLEKAFAILEITTHPQRILCLFQAVINRMHGIEPFVDGCVRCRRQNHICAISILDGGFVCQSCFRNVSDFKYSKNRLQHFRLLCKAGIENYEILKRIDDFTFEDFFELFDFFQEYAGVSIKSIRFLKSVIQMEKGR